MIDAEGKSMGRLATQVATVLIGKDKATYVPNVDAGDFVHVRNVAKVKVTGAKLTDKEYKWYTGYQGGLRTKRVGEVFEKDPAEVLRRAVRNMLPKNSHQAARMRRLRVTA